MTGPKAANYESREGENNGEMEFIVSRPFFVIFFAEDNFALDKIWNGTILVKFLRVFYSTNWE